MEREVLEWQIAVGITDSYCDALMMENVARIIIKQLYGILNAEPHPDSNGTAVGNSEQ